ncbi:WG repeat-containing protein [Halocola ammonii]
MKRSFVLAVISLLSLLSFGQSFSDAEIENWDPVITYYNFYDGIQMIEIDYLTAYHNRVNQLEQQQPRAMHWDMVLGPPPPNVYIFRNKAGIRVKQFGEITGKVKILSVKKSLKVMIPHNHLYARIGASFGFSHLRTKSYPYYRIGSSNDGEGGFGLIDSLGNKVLDTEYDEILSNFNGSIFVTKKGELSELRNKNLEIQLSTKKYALTPAEQDGFVVITRNQLRGLMDYKGEIVVPCKYKIIWPFNDYGLAKVRNKNNLEGFVNSNGEEVIKCKYQSFGEFTEGLISARLFLESDYKRGFIDTTGKVIVPFIYNHAFWFTEGLARVSKKIDGTYYFGFIDKEGNEVIPLKYANATDFKNGVAEVRTDFPNSNEKVRSVNSEVSNERQGEWVRINRIGELVD